MEKLIAMFVVLTPIFIWMATWYIKVSINDLKSKIFNVKSSVDYLQTNQTKFVPLVEALKVGQKAHRMELIAIEAMQKEHAKILHYQEVQFELLKDLYKKMYGEEWLDEFSEVIADGKFKASGLEIDKIFQQG